MAHLLSVKRDWARDNTMTFEFKCPQCRQSVETDETMRGQVAQCPHCGKGIVIPRSSAKLGIRRPVGGHAPENDGRKETAGGSIPFSNRFERREKTSQPPKSNQLNGKSSKGMVRKILVVMGVIVGVGVICCAVSVGCYWYFGDTPRLVRGEASYKCSEYEKAFKLLFPLAKKGYPTAQLYVGDCYLNGTGTIKNSEEAVKWYRSATEKEFPEAYHRMFVCVRDGIGVDADSGNAAKWCRKAAEAGVDQAMFDMALLYVNGKGVESNAKSAFKWFRKGAERGHLESLYRLGLCYKLGFGVGKDEDEASKWQDKAVSGWRKDANSGGIGSMIRLAESYMNGDVVEMDAAEGVKWYRKAAELGNAQAQFQLALCYAAGKGVEQEDEEAAKWMLKSAVQGKIKMSQWAMGCLYLEGKGVEKNAVEAVKWFERSAKKGFPPAKYSLAMCCFKGEGVEKDVERGETLLTEASDAGEENARRELDRIKAKRTEAARREAEETKMKYDRIEKLSSIEKDIRERKKFLNDVLGGRQKGDWAEFDASKIALTDSSVSVAEELAYKSLSGRLGASADLSEIDSAIASARLEVERLEARQKEFSRVKRRYDEKELASRKEVCSPCGGTGLISCARCRGTGIVASQEQSTCPVCLGNGTKTVSVTCPHCNGAKRFRRKCAVCKGKGTVRNSDSRRLDNRETCWSCNGSGRGDTEDCPKCSGNGNIDVEKKCSKCAGHGNVSNGGKVECPGCGGKCKLECNRCGGRGFTYRPKGNPSE